EGPAHYDERSHAREAAQSLGTEHSEVVVSGQDVREALAHIIRHMDQPTVDGINTYFVSKAARQGVTVALSGLGGDEVFGGYPSFLRVPRLMPYLRAWNLVPADLRRALQNWGERWAIDSVPLRKLRGLRQLESLPALYAGSRIYFWPEEKQRLYTPDFRERLGQATDSITWLKRYLNSTSEPPEQQVTRLEIQSYMSEMLLRDTDAMSMAHSLEVRVPFLDHKLVEFAVRIPPAVKFKQGMTKVVLAQAVSDLLPSWIISRHKQAFELPMAHWLADDLERLVRQSFASQPLQDERILDSGALSMICDEMTSRYISWRHRWLIASLGFWLESLA
ncbi:MAG: asparagine synthase, partial [Chloroflexi bacterium]|nr:asparagine synthase [Chloroflexota bacterium]